MSITVTVIPPPKAEYKVRIEADLSLREAAILQAIIGVTVTRKGLLGKLYQALADTTEVNAEREELSWSPANIDVRRLEEA